ncbi:1,2-dihydroxy-3-keto-5-methylthiopentene dioxygenase [Lecanora helva]
MASSGGTPGGGSDAGGSGAGQNQGTEYTLQGVMRFLQTEWHRHERDRNAWQIERAEMKSRIGKLEGDGRTNKRLRESLDKHVRILENALKQERQKNKASETPEEKKGETQKQEQALKPSLKPRLSKPHNSFLDLEQDEQSSPNLRHESERDRSRLYLGKCLEEVQYHVLSLSSQQQQQYNEEQEPPLQNHQYPNQQPPTQQSLEDVYVRQGQKPQSNNIGILQPSPMPNNHPPHPSIPRVSEVPGLSRGSQPPEQSSYVSRSLPERQTQQQNAPLTAIDRSNPNRSDFGFPAPEDRVEKVAHSYNSYGHPIASQEEDSSHVAEEPELADADGWNFDDPPDPPSVDERPPPEYPPPQRPDTDVFPNANSIAMKSPTRGGIGSHRRKSSLSKRRQSDDSHELRELSTSHIGGSLKGDPGQFKVRFALRGHLDAVRSVIFTGGGSPAQPEICSAGDDGVIKRWTAGNALGKGDDLDLKADHTHRGHIGSVLCLAASPAYPPFSNGGRVQGDGWIFSGGQDATVRVWERGRVDPKATLDGHTDAVWTVCVLPGTSATILGDQSTNHGGPDRTILASGAADGTILIWAVSSPPQLSSPQTGSRRGTGNSRRANSVSAGSNFPSSPQPNTATSRPFQHSLVHRIERADHPSPTCISPLSIGGDTFVVSFADASVLIFNTRTGEELVGMASLETYDGTPATQINAVAATIIGPDGSLSFDSGRGISEDESNVHGATGSSSGVEGMVLSGHEDRHIRFFDANSGQCTYSMLAHPSAISSLSLSPSGAELVSAGHDASLRFWSLEKRSCSQEITSHRLMRGEGVCSVVWSQDGRWVVSGGGDGVVKVFSRVGGGGGGSGSGGGGGGSGEPGGRGGA